MYKKFLYKLVASITVIFVFLSVMPVYAASSDIKGNWAEKEIQRWVGRGVLNGNGGKFQPNASISRAEFVTIVNRVFGFTSCAAIKFSDVKSKDWYALDIGKAVAAGILKGSDGKVRPNSPVSRQEAAVIFARVFDLEARNAKAVDKYKDGKSVPSWSRDALNAMAENGYMSSRLGSVLNPAANISRAEAVKMLDNIVTVYINKPGTYTNKEKGNILINSSKVTLKSTAVSGNLYLTQGIGKGTVTLDKVTVNGMTVINGGGEKGITVKDSSLKGKVLVDNEINKNRIVESGKTTMPEITVKNDEGSGKQGGNTTSGDKGSTSGSTASAGSSTGSAVTTTGSAVSTTGSAVSGGAGAAGGVPAGGTPAGTPAGGTPSGGSSSNLKLLGATAVVGGQRIDATQQSDGKWLVNLKGKSGSLTDITVSASSDVAKAEFSIMGRSDSVPFSSGQATLNIHQLMEKNGLPDSGEPGISVASISSFNITQLPIQLKSSSGASADVTIQLVVD